jgi:hypothetical protein
MNLSQDSINVKEKRIIHCKLYTVKSAQVIPFRPRLFKWRNIVLSSALQHSPLLIVNRFIVYFIFKRLSRNLGEEFSILPKKKQQISNTLHVRNFHYNWQDAKRLWGEHWGHTMKSYEEQAIWNFWGEHWPLLNQSWLYTLYLRTYLPNGTILVCWLLTSF